MLKFFSIILIFSLTIPTQTTHTIPLSFESKKFIATWAAIGGSIGGLLGAVVYAKAPQKESEKSNTFWSKLADISKYIVAPFSIGALIIGGSSYCYCNNLEKSLALAISKVDSLNNDHVLGDLIDFSEILDKNYKRDLSSFNIPHGIKDNPYRLKTFLKEHYQQALLNLKKILTKVSTSKISELARAANKYLQTVDRYIWRLAADGNDI